MEHARPGIIQGNSASVRPLPPGGPQRMHCAYSLKRQEDKDKAS